MSGAKAIQTLPDDFCAFCISKKTFWGKPFMKSLLLLDHFDSFTFNLVQLFALAGKKPRVLRSHASLNQVRKENPAGLIIGPGPDDPARCSLAMAAIAHFTGRIPILGICLGMQCLAEAFGGQTVRAIAPVHGKTSLVFHDAKGILRGVPTPFTACRYHSLAVQLSEESSLVICARAEDGTAMALRHSTLPIHGLQFHPESFLSESGHQMALNFLGELT
jgi:anthranilate synthase component 2